MTQILATYSIKGGVGKTTTAVNLAYLSAKQGSRTLLWDLDPQAAATYLLRVKPKIRGGGKSLIRGRSELGRLIRGSDFAGLDLLPADVSYRHMDLHLARSKRPTQRLARVLAPLRHDYDMIILDCPPSLSLVSESVFQAAATLLIPMIPAPLPARTLDQLQHFLSGDKHRPAKPGSKSRRQPQTLAFFTMVDRRRRIHREIIEDLTGNRSEVLATCIPSTTSLELMGVRRSPVEDFQPKSAAAESYRALWAEIGTRLTAR
ncbi:MAG TPA: AAA family ATPase [Acidimicrobiales bacterium]|nr:AAA family ATPase [Acidimicrobiales bacterium]